MEPGHFLIALTGVRPEIVIDPEDGASSPKIKSIKVLLPPPEGPTNAMNLPSETSKEISWIVSSVAPE